MRVEIADVDAISIQIGPKYLALLKTYRNLEGDYVQIDFISVY
jgi:hypothetical protein